MALVLKADGKTWFIPLVSGFLLAVFLSYFQYSIDGLSGAPAALSKSNGKSGKALPLKGKMEPALSQRLRDHPAPHPSFFKVDYKQNLLVWPVVACGVARSPPSAISL